MRGTMSPEECKRICEGITCKDTSTGGPHGWIQWKGTNVCMDVWCECGQLTHVDADFCYFIECGHCGRKWSVGAHVPLHPLTEEECRYVETETCGFTKSE